MKKILAAMAVMVLPVLCWGQAQIDTKKVKISDFTQKITKVVLTGNQFHDAVLKNEVTSKWHVSPFEFCTMDEFDTLKSDDDYYFLLTTKGQFRKETEPGLIFLTLVKGGKAERGIDGMLEIVSFPYSSADEPSGREVVFLPVILGVIQNYAAESMDKDVSAYIGLPNYTMNISKSGDMTLVFSENDLSEEVTPEIKNMCFDEKVLILEESKADEYVNPQRTNTLVSYVIAPASAKPGSYCYKVLIDPHADMLYYFRKHRISKKTGPGFLAEDLRRITAPRQK
ncbi:MAG: hypothetical protein E7124_00720 [Bacteroidales bacterium]|nr:hypothetical protein [Bacteroidales bacterium]